MEWLNEPRTWSGDAAALTLVTDRETDFWQETFYGFRHDNGHVFGRRVDGDFTAEVEFAGGYEAQYDQAGLMIRADAANWLKTGIEFAHGRATLGAVLTRGGLSDWSIGPAAPVTGWTRLRVTRRGPALCVEAAADGEALALLRLGPIGDAPSLLVGMMACSPSRAGFDARFRGFRVGEAVDVSGAV
jgi:regulation of enolase protein 1 (concanavalin A-like superfamily)